MSSKPVEPLMPVRSPLRSLKWKSSGQSMYYGDFRITPVVAMDGMTHLVHRVIGTKHGQYRYERVVVLKGPESKEAAKNYVETTHLLGEE